MNFELQQDRRTFLKSTAALGALTLFPLGAIGAPQNYFFPAGRKLKPAVFCAAFFYPPADVVLAGKNEDSWAPHEWFTWPGNQFEPEKQEAKFTAQVRKIAGTLGAEVRFEPKALYTNAAITEFIKSLDESKPDALLLFNFWNSFSAKLRPILEAWKGPIILYQPVGANHQLPPELFRTAPRVQYIHSIENWESIERGMRAVHAHTRMAQARLLRVSGRVTAARTSQEPFFGTTIHEVPASEFNTIYDEIKITPEMERLAKQVRRSARRISDLADNAFVDAVRSHVAVQQIMGRHQADAITIECLMLKHRKPCLSFSMNNGNLTPCGCENDLDATLTLMLCTNCFGRGGFQHNPDFDTDRNLYYGSHCTCATRLRGPAQKAAVYDLRPFFHQMPKTLAMDVQWPAGETVTLCKYQSATRRLNAWRGQVINSPGCPPTGGCATRVVVKLDEVPDVCGIYSGPHPSLYCGDFAKHLKTYAQLYGVEIKTNC